LSDADDGRSSARRKAGVPMAAALSGAGVLALAKGKGLLVLLKGIKAVPFLLSMGSMLAMVAFEAQRSGWLFGVGFVLMILVHELGHGAAIRREGLPAGYPIFVPFFGAMIALKGQPRSSLCEARIAIAGPVAGTLAALVMAAMYLTAGTRLWLALAYSGFFLNLFNMIPLAPLDGGRVAQVFSRRMSIVGVALMLGLFLVSPSPQLALIGLFSLTHAFSRRQQAEAGPDEATVTVRERRQMAFTYFGVCAFLALGMWLSGRLLGH
jgi:Zn-dependent protease